MPARALGKIILVHGASSSGKTTLCRALQARTDAPFWHYSIDHLRGSGVLPIERIDRGDFDWSENRLEDNVDQVLAAWRARTRPSAFERMRAADGGDRK